MIVFFKSNSNKIIAVQFNGKLNENDLPKLNWLLAATQIKEEKLAGFFVGPRKEMVSPWSTNAVEITQNMGINNIVRVEEYKVVEGKNAAVDPMLEILYTELNQDLFTINIKPEEVLFIDNIKAYSDKEGLALSDDEVEYLENVVSRIGRKLTDSEVFGFSQVNSEALPT